MLLDYLLETGGGIKLMRVLRNSRDDWLVRERGEGWMVDGGRWMVDREVE